MISLADAKRVADGFRGEELRRLVPEVLLGRYHLSAAGRSFESQPEDLLAPLLKARVEPHYLPLLAGARDFLRLAAPYLVVATDPPTAELRTGLLHFAALISLAEPAELEAEMLRLTQLALDDPALDEDLREALITAAMTYAREGAASALWERCLRHGDFAAYGFTALLRIDPHAPRIDAALRDLWVRHLRDETVADAALLTEETAEARGGVAFLPALFSALAEVLEPEEFGCLRRELAADADTAPWLRFLPESESGSKPPTMVPVILRASLCFIVFMAFVAAIASARTEWARQFLMLALLAVCLVLYALTSRRAAYE